MISYEDAIQLIQESYDSMYRSGMINTKVTITDDTQILGNSPVLDSLGFVTLFTDLEDRIERKTNKEIYLVLDEIIDFDINSPYLSARMITNYIVEKINK